MSDTVSWSLRLAIREDKLADARALMQEMVKATRLESGTTGYEWFVDEAAGICHINERYVDSAAAVAHLGNFGATFAERFMECFEPTDFVVYGAPADSVREILDGFGASYLEEWGGFTR